MKSDQRRSISRRCSPRTSSGYVLPIRLLIEERYRLPIGRWWDRLQVRIDVLQVLVRQHRLLVRGHRAVGGAHEGRQCLVGHRIGRELRSRDWRALSGVTMTLIAPIFHVAGL